MDYVEFGKTGMKVSRSAFGALPLQRLGMDDSVKLLRRAYDGGINFFDTARGYSDSEEKLGEAFKDGIRSRVYIATKSGANNVETLRAHIETSLKMLKTDYVDLYQFHNNYPSDELIEAARGFVKEGKALHIGITLHKRDIAVSAVDSGKFESLQFPFSGLSDDEDVALVRSCEAAGMGFIAMKALSGGLVKNIEANFAYIRSVRAALPIWGIQRVSELDEFLALEAAPPEFDAGHKAALENEKRELGDRFCRGCGYCQPCPANIDIGMSSRMDLLLKRMPTEQFLSAEWRDKMSRIENCTMCRACESRCPYHLKPYELIKKQLPVYREFIEAHAGK